MNCTLCTHTPHLDRILARQRRILVTDLLLWGLISAGLLVVALAA
ncbi:MAG TPA: hypothetical protein VFU21_04425 [Kofleriaceae bacterium]|nr:hypothetical protein [Kofleriaceae bacterium]